MKKAFAQVLYYCGLVKLFYFLNRKAKRIITFHNVLPDGRMRSDLANGLSVSESELAKVVEEVETVFGFSTNLTDANTCTITFDDGYLNQFANYANLDVSGIKHFIREIGYEGLFSIEFLHSKGQYYFLEINLRNDGTSYLNAAAGFNLQILWYKYVTGQSIKEGFAKQSIFKPLCLMQFSDLYSLKNRSVSPVRWMWQCLTARVHFVLNTKDMAPFFGAMFYMFRRKSAKAIRRLHQCA